MVKYLLIIFAFLYVLSPYDFVPDFFFGWGWLDDLILLWVLWRYLKTPGPTGFGSGGYQQQRRKYFESGRERGRGNDSRGGESETIKDSYTILGIERGAPREEIKKAYKQLASKYHPDKVNYLGDEFKKLAEERFKEIQKAYQELMERNL
ncbi:MAG: DnaJ domain-containing protein [Deltaproteobacteria bacterium]|nr:DnaJ domain-containing protein [Deltaproteobacteria bacterium]